MDDMLVPADIIGVKRDIADIEKALNTIGIVYPRYGEPFYSLPLAIQKVIEAGGFEPFLTEAQLLASIPSFSPKAAKALDTKKIWYWGKYSEDETVDSWHDTGLSELDQANDFTYGAIANLIATQVQATQSYNLKKDLNKENLYYNYDGTTVELRAVTTTDYIPITEGDAWNMTCLLTKMNSGIVSFAFFDANKVFNSMKGFEYNRVGTILSQDVTETQYIEKSNHASIFAPITGYMRFTYYTEFENVLYLNKVDQSMALELRRNSCGLQPYALDSFKGIRNELRTITIDPLYSKGMYYKQQVVGDALHYNIDTDLRDVYGMTGYIPVTKGQYLHTCLPVDELGYPIYLVDANKNFIKTIGNDYLLNNPNSFASIANINYLIEQDGFITFNLHKLIEIGGFYALTDSPIEKHNPNYITNSSKLAFYNVSHSPADVTATVLLDYSGQAVDSVDVVTFIGSQPDGDSYMTKPMWLRKGEVLEFVNTHNKPVIGILFKDSTAVVTHADPVAGTPEVTRRVIRRQTWVDPAKVTLEGWLNWKAVDPNETARPSVFNDGVTSASHYCDFENDTMFMLYIPNSNTDNFRTHKLSFDNSFRVLSKNEYIDYRNNNLEALTPLGKINRELSEYAAYIDGTMEWFKPVIVFKDEVFTCISNTGKIRVFFNNWITNSLQRGMYTNETHTDLVDRPIVDIDLNVKHSFKTNTMLFDTTMNICTGIYYLKPDGNGRYNKDNVYVNLDTIRKSMRVMHKDYYKLGYTATPNLIPTGGVSVPNMTVEGKYVKGGFFPVKLLNDYDLMSAVLLAGRRYKFKSFGYISDIIFVPYDSIKKNYEYSLIPNALTIGDLPQPWGSRRDIAIEQYFSPETDGVVYLNSRTANRNNEDGTLNLARVFTDDTTTGGSNLQIAQYQLDIVEVSEAEYLANTTIFKGTSLNVPVDNAITIKFLSGISGDAVAGEMRSVVQICSAGQPVATLNCVTANQGQSTAYAYKRNINIEFFNDKWKNVYVCFGDNFEESEIVLKSNSGTDLAQVRDAFGNEIWRRIRRARPFGDNTLIPFDLFNLRSEPANVKAQCSTFAFPCEAYVGDTFLGVYTLRNKKKRGNYAMKKKEKKHILMQIDWSLHGLLNWPTVSLQYFELRNPEIIGYTAGDDALPAGNDAVSTSLNNFFTWARGVMANTINFKNTYKNNINLDSFIDYILQLAIIGNRDSVTNNALLGTWDGKIWNVFPYDLDGSLGVGWIADPETSPYYPLSSMLNVGNNTLFNVIYTNYPELVTKRYVELRNNNVVSIDLATQMIRDVGLQVSTVSYTADIKMFDIVPQSFQEFPQILTWIYKRLRYLDAFFGYLPSDAVSMTLYNPPTLQPNESHVFNLPANVVVGDVLNYEFGNPLLGTTITLSVVTNGQIRVEHKNPTAAAINPSSETYLRIFKV
ncbi:CotH kinase family protein [Acinetobacter sp. UC24323]|uniref:CotH kinase family protein n=1 Tax=Acinetobacter sp. UC24323 TaxID=2839946 RepID=UPI00209D5ECC|nr:CotH kinase family protein [Acinetobacter sp. UC24323]MCO9048746.1 CotH kinase family protein [Acinetobacter sp. UC24323]